MRTSPVALSDLRGVFPVPPLPRRRDSARTIDFAETARLAAYIRAGGCDRLLFGGNAFLYHASLAEIEALLDWMAAQPDDCWLIPSAGPSFGRLLDQAPLLRRYAFPCVMVLPCADPRDPGGIEAGLREFAAAASTPLMLYLKDETNFGADRDAGLDVVGRLAADGICVAIKYAVVRQDPLHDSYLEALLQRVPESMVISGIGERPAVAHMSRFGLPGFTTGSGCVAPALSRDLFEACARGDYDRAASIRQVFLPLEDLRDAWGPARVLHAAVASAGIAETGPIAPFVSPVTADQIQRLAPVARELAAAGSPPVQAKAGR